MYQVEYILTRKDTSVERIILETKTYLVHDVCHYVVEKKLDYYKGFWGMLSQGYSFNELFGKDNLLTTELRFIEQVVGPVQSTYLGNIPKQKFEMFLQHIDFNIPAGFLEICLTEIARIMKSWEQLSVGEQLILEWN